MDQQSCLLLLLLFLVSADHTSAVDCGDPVSPDPCVPVTDANCVGCPGLMYVEDPFDCYSFYVCDDEALAFSDHFNCPIGEVFNPGNSACESGTCTSRCTPPIGGNCLYSCGPNPNGNIADRYDCSTYYKCTGGTMGIAQSCPPTAPYFDGALCQKDITRCCHCHPYCYAWDKGELVDDPKDCRRYYFCVDEGNPAFSGKCNPGEYFDAHLQGCSVNMHCITPCKNVVGSDGCIDPYTCVEKGYFPKCPSLCRPEYYHCTVITDIYIDPISCPLGYVFHPNYLACVKEDSCP